MTNEEFQQWLDAEYQKYPLIARSKQKTINELVYVLRMSGKDFTLNTIGRSFGCIPSIQETFIPTKTLALRVKAIEYEEYEDAEMPLLAVGVDGE